MATYKIRLGNTEVGLTNLDVGDPSMGVAGGEVALSCDRGGEVDFLTGLGALQESDGLLVITNNPELNVFDENDDRVESEFCYLAFADDLNECVVNACAIPSEIYKIRFPEQWAEYWGGDS